jgi:hypothetical protein
MSAGSLIYGVDYDELDMVNPLSLAMDKKTVTWRNGLSSKTLMA